MNTVQKKQRSRRPVSRRLLLIIALAALSGIAVCCMLLTEPPVTQTPADVVTYGELYVHNPSDVRSLTISQRDKASWTLRQSESGECLLDGHESWPLDTVLAQSLISAASVVSYEKILTDDPADYAGHLDDFGLADPHLTVSVAYADETAVAMHIGAPIQGIDMSYVYMLLDGDNRLFALDKGTFDTLNIDPSLLHTVPQPTIHKARIDRITFTGADGQTAAEWMLPVSITDADAAAQWHMTHPYRYPADVDALNSLRQNLSNLRLGAFVCEATQETLAAYGLDAPRFIITVHQAEGTTNSISSTGEVEFVTWPESTFTLSVGNPKNDNVDYVLVDGYIYTASHFTLEPFMRLAPLDTLSRYPVNIAAGVLQEMTVSREGNSDVYRITRETEDNADEAVFRISATLNGQSISYDAFEAAYIRLLTSRVSGLLPENWTTAEAPHTTFTLVTDSGLRQTIALASFDALHDAVFIDGHAVFYLIKNGMDFSLDAVE